MENRYEKWIKETRLDIRASPRTQVARKKEDPRGQDRQIFEAQRGRDAAEGIQYRSLARFSVSYWTK
jgi:hypothetical protein